MNDQIVQNPEAYKPGTWGCHEALDRCSLLAELVDDFSEHPAIHLNPEWKAKADQAAKILADLYQDIGSIHLPAAPEEQRLPRVDKTSV